jgi:hypothetical protein
MRDLRSMGIGATPKELPLPSFRRKPESISALTTCHWNQDGSRLDQTFGCCEAPGRKKRIDGRRIGRPAGDAVWHKRYRAYAQRDAQA